jgi:hypothetical protein
MKKIAISLMLFFAFQSPLLAAGTEYEATVVGQFLLISEKKEVFTPNVIALRKSTITSVRLVGATVVVRTSESDYEFVLNDKGTVKRASPAVHKFVTEDDKQAKRLFDFILGESGS